MVIQYFASQTSFGTESKKRFQVTVAKRHNSVQDIQRTTTYRPIYYD